MAGAVVSCPPAILPIFRPPRVNVRAHRALRATSPSPEPVLAVRARWGWRQSAFRTSKTATGRFGPHTPAARSFLAVLGRFSGLCGRLVCARFGFAARPLDGGKVDHHRDLVFGQIASAPCADDRQHVSGRLDDRWPAVGQPKQRARLDRPSRRCGDDDLCSTLRHLPPQDRLKLWLAADRLGRN
jgi:hypothetical protein